MFFIDPPGPTEEVVNCRCALLQMARWALDEEELETLKERAECFGLDKSDEFEDFKKNYLKAIENSENNGIMKLPDIEIRRSVGVKARNYDILDLDTLEVFHFVAGTKIQDAEVFAGKGSHDKYINAWKYANAHGGNVEDWHYCKGKGLIDTPDGAIRAEVHWSQCAGIGKFDFFI